METKANKQEDSALCYGKSLILFVMFPIGYWVLKVYGFRFQEDPSWLLVSRMFFGTTSFVLAYFVAGRSSDTSLSDRERRIFRVICFFAITPALGLLLIEAKG